MGATDLSRNRNTNGKGDTQISKHERGFIPPTLTIKEIREAIPAHCFERNALHSLAYVLHDLFFIGILMYIATFISLLPSQLRPIAWIIYWIAQGVVMVGPWILAHECGHGGFSDSKNLNTVVGWLLHSALLVPFQAWKISHGKHHKGTGSMERDVVFVPSTRSDREKIHHFASIFEDAPLFSLIQLTGGMIFGWFFYLGIDMAGPTKKSWVSHFHTSNDLFSVEHRPEIIKSNLGIVIAISVLAYLSHVTSFTTVLFYYGIPYLQVNAWITLITYLQHTDVEVPHYREAEWNFVRGAICTVDRPSFGKIICHFHHHIADTHVAHHLFSQMPFYKAQEATVHLKRILGEHYMEDNTSIPMALWRSWKQCAFVENSGDVVFYKSRKEF
eukprot:TRINITY_DN1849_c0_g1_i1.p1 TRINITY_DN1849_c0_g1~~TRINITY_DN1849_c0_g1_i1.p1  ORF type:complete len:387 (-),score=55.79 TRINITY_DN1849_c0_g1_i1:58-1218(-)